MRPTTLDEVVGAAPCACAGIPAAPSRRLGLDGFAHRPELGDSIRATGCGQDYTGHIVAKQSGRQYEELSAVTSGVKDLREVLRRAHERLVSQGKETVLFIDEVHRFSKSQQDALLPSVENRDVTFIAATTENPSFSVIKPLLSRSVVVKLESLEPEELRTVIERAVSNPRGLGGKVRVQGDAVDGSFVWRAEMPGNL